MIFSSQRAVNDGTGDDGYGEVADRMVELAAAQPGFLGIESVRGADGAGITVSYWRSLADIAAWRDHAEHRVAQEDGDCSTRGSTCACARSEKPVRT